MAKDNEVMVAISNANYAQPGGMLDLWMAGVKRSNVTNALVIALDDATQQHAESLGFTAYQMKLQVFLLAPAAVIICTPWLSRIIILPKTVLPSACWWSDFFLRKKCSQREE